MSIDAAKKSNGLPDKADMTRHGLRGRTVVILFCIAVVIVALVLGWSFVFILIGLMPGIAIFYVFVKDRESARKLFGPPYYNAVGLVARVLVPIGFGVYALIAWGFCRQNLICVLLR